MYNYNLLMIFANKYKPTTQKSLFHADIIKHIKKWIKTVEDIHNSNKNAKFILYLYGPIGCAKSVTIECLFKSYNIIPINSDNLRSVDKLNDILDLILDFTELTLEHFGNLSSRKKGNILLIDNIEFCEKNLENFINVIHGKYNRNIPIILISNNKKYLDMFIDYPNCTNLEFKPPSLLELTKLLNVINKNESLNLTKENIKVLIQKSQFDIRQLLFILEQWYYTNSIKTSENKTTFDDFINALGLKDKDIDLYEKLLYLFNKDTPHTLNFNCKNIIQICSSEPQIVSNSIYQNYINIYTSTKTSNLSQHDNLQILNNYANLMDSISFANTIQNEIYENQNWHLYNHYTIASCAIPAYYLHLNTKILSNYTNLNNYQFIQFKDISYNFLKSYEEVKTLCRINQCNSNYNYKNCYSYILTNVESCYTMITVMIKCIDVLNDYFNANKKGKNTTKKEKLLLCNNIETDPAKKSLDIIINNIYYYKLFEIDLDQFIINKSKYINDEIIKENINLIDLRLFKRLLNIFTFDDSHKKFKSNIEISIQYKLLQLLITEFNTEKQNIVKDQDIQNLTVNIEDIWNF